MAPLSQGTFFMGVTLAGVAVMLTGPLISPAD
jgi:hypothetical protein